MGSGTAVLAILAAMKGAKSGLAIDNDPNAFENAPENVELNNITNIEVVMGDAATLKGYKSFDIVFANINKNILLNDIKHYSKVMQPGARIFFSGFYQDDLGDIENECKIYGLAFMGKREKNNWLAVEFVKQ
jgi:ribosomal protein L11 methyltransferase